VVTCSSDCHPAGDTWGSGHARMGEMGLHGRRNVAVHGKLRQMTADLTGVWKKFDRACAHFGAFEGLLADWFAANGPGMCNAVEEDRWHVYRWIVRRQPALDEFAVVAGDMFHNLRATLDYLVYQLVIAAGSSPKPKQNSFPVVQLDTEWKMKSGGSLNGMSDADKDKIKTLQPFGPSHNGPVSHHMLVMLDTLNNIYKHRLLPLAVMSVSELRLAHTFDEGSHQADYEYHFTDRPVADGGEFYRFRFTPDIPYRVQVTEPPELRVWFDDSNLSHRWNFADMIEWVRQAILIFE
jgi:hypothetical protein